MDQVLNFVGPDGCLLVDEKYNPLALLDRVQMFDYVYPRLEQNRKNLILVAAEAEYYTVLEFIEYAQNMRDADLALMNPVKRWIENRKDRKRGRIRWV